ncbi:MAG: hypothetical protein K2O89_00955 [Clostridia bacterium]|nr:hypothetical protein [Clostridia bacterium]
MKRRFKFLLVLLATFCVTLTCAAIAACNDDSGHEGDGGELEQPIDYGDPTKDGYRVTVLYPDGSIVKGSDADFQLDTVNVELLDEEGTSLANANLNESGVAQFAFYTPGEYHIKINDYPAGYDFDSTEAVTSADKAFYTVSLKLAPPTPYTVNVKYPDGTAIEGVTVKFMSGTTVAASATTNANGVATTADPLVRGVYEVVLENVPLGYTYKPTTTTIAAYPVTINTVGATDITFEDADKLDSTGVQVWDNALNSYGVISVVRFDKDGDNYEYSANLAAGEEVFFRIHAPKTGEYIIGSMQGNDYVIQFYANDFSYVDSTLTISSATNGGNNIQKMRIEEGEILTFSVKTQSRQAGVVNILICLPVPEPITQTATSVGNYTLTFRDVDTAILKFVTSTTAGEGFGAGVYRITSHSDRYDVMLVEYANNYPLTSDDSDLTGEYFGLAGNDNGAGDGLNFVYEKSWTQSYLNGSVDYHVIIKDADITFPVVLSVTIERIGDAEPEQEVTKEIAHANVSVDYADQTGTFTWMPTNGSLVPYERNGKWYVEVDGEEKALVVAITKNLPGQFYSFATVEYYGEGEEISSSRQNASLTVYADMNTMDTTWNYTNFIEAYALHVNKDGVYEVNNELKLFLERYMNQRFSNITGSTTAPAMPWLLGCGYYA